jgi:alpha-glucosidase (family GH31 glycosyl hydrolase)
MTFASQIQENGFNNSQLEIDDRWESCYGEQTFDNKKFSDPKQMNDQLHNLVK